MTSVGNMPYYAVTSGEKAKARRLERRGLVTLTAERDSRVMTVSGKARLVGREILYVEPKERNA